MTISSESLIITDRDKELYKMAFKMYENSFYPPYGPVTFFPFNIVSRAKEITEEARRKHKEIEEQIRKQLFD